jgi:hypothetical protein
MHLLAFFSVGVLASPSGRFALPVLMRPLCSMPFRCTPIYFLAKPTHRQIGSYRMCSFFIPPPSFGMVEAGIYRCTLPSSLSQVFRLLRAAAFVLYAPFSPL